MKYYGKAEETAKKLVNAFKAGEIPEKLAWVFVHRSDNVPCRAWSWKNQVIVAIHGTPDARGFKQWKQAGRSVKKGAKALYILGPCLKKVEDKENPGEKKNILFGFKSIPVFALEDTEGKDIPVDEHAEQFLDGLPLRNVAASWGISVSSYNGEHSQAAGYYSHGGENGPGIALGAENLVVWTHELAHAADDRLGTLKGSSKHSRELVAMLAGSTLLECLGFTRDSDPGSTWNYILGYCGNDPEKAANQCGKLLDRVAKVVDLILTTADAARVAA